MARTLQGPRAAQAPEGGTTQVASPVVRLERKFAAGPPTEGELLWAVKRLPGLFEEDYPARYVNSLYLDTYGLRNYVAALDGVSPREKVRVRWYGGLFRKVRKPALEIKRREGSTVRKETFAIGELATAGLGSAALAGALAGGEAPGAARLKVRGLGIVLLNRYRRMYFRSRDGRLRVTVDTGMVFHRYNRPGGFSSAVPASGGVLEMKYAAEHEDAARAASQALPWRLSRHSKYARGVELLGLS